MNRRTMMTGMAMAAAVFNAQATESKSGSHQASQEVWDKIFPKSEKVTHRKVHFSNRFGIELVGDLYEPKGHHGALGAVAVCGPFGAVKEQSSGLYAQTLAENGFAALAFDPSFTGESAGVPRNVASPDLNTEDFSAAVDFLSCLPEVNPKRIGILGICGWGGFALNAAAADTRIKATVTSTMYDMSRVNANGYFDSMGAEGRRKLKEELNRQRTKDFVSGTKASADGLPEKLSGNEPQFVKDYWDFYKTARGFHPRSINSNGHWNKTSALSFINTPLQTYTPEITSAVLLIHGEKAHSRYFSEDAFKRLRGDNKELMIIPEAVHTDLYDNQNKKIPWEKIIAFYRQFLPSVA